MSLFFGPCSAFLLVLCLSGLTTEVHAQAAPDFWKDAETKEPVIATTSIASGCSFVPRLDFAQPQDEFLDQNTFSTGSKVYYKCRPGYVHIPGSIPYAICNANGTWSFSGKFCMPSGCGFLPRLDFAQPKEEFLNQPTFSTGSKVYYTCRLGYVHIPGSIPYAICNEDGTWSFSGEFCMYNFKETQVPSTTDTSTSKASGCGFVPRLEFAHPKDEFLDQPTFSTGSKVSYTCRPGYVRIPGISSATCNDDGTWTFPGNFCTRRKCGNPGDVENADMQAQDFLFGSKVIYTCNQGYRMVSKRNYRECLADGTWSNTLPICEAQLCPQPSDIINGEFYPVKEEYAYLDSVTYFCHKFLALIGDGTISCMENGQWSSNAPQCRLVHCSNPFVTNSRKISGTSGPYYLNSVVRFRCNSDYVLNGSDAVTCNENSQWEPALPKCLDFCRFAPVIKYADLLEPPRNKYVDGTTLTFKCKEGFDPVPGANNVLTCLGKVWTKVAEFCAPVFCGHPGTIRNGYIEDGSFYFGSRVTFACNTGYKINGHNYRECQANGSWSFPIPECTVRTCPHFNISLGTSVIPVKPQYQYNDTLTFSCREGFHLTGASQSVCNHDGKWHPAPASCKSICYAPPELEFAEHSYQYNETFTEDETVQYTCKNGYTRDFQHMNILKCLGYFEWSRPEQFCSRISCGSPGDIKHGNYEVKDFLFDSEAIYKCEKGYKMASVNSTRKCLATKTWSGPVPRCKVQTCSPPEDIVNGFYNNKNNIYVYLDSVTYKCHNLTLVGEASISCTAEGKWTSGAPECKAVCKSPSQLKYGEPIKKCSQNQYFEVGKTLKYKCRPGYVFTGNKSSEITCLNNFTWTEPEEFCERQACNNPGTIDHGLMHYENFLFESRVNYTCMPGYNMISRRNYRFCQADGTWSGTPPVCKESICEKMWELQEETRKCTSTPEDWMKYLQVQLLYFQIENLKLDIEIKKKKLLSAEESITREKEKGSIYKR